MASIKSIHIEGYRSLRDVTLEPGRITVLIGPNGAGKSNLLSALRLLNQMQRQLLRITVGKAGGANAQLHNGSETTRDLGLAIDFGDDDGPLHYEVTLTNGLGDTFFFVAEGGTEVGEGVYSGHNEAFVGQTATGSRFDGGRTSRALAGIRTYHFHDTSVLSRFSRQEDTRELHVNGENLAAYLYLLANGTSDSYRAAWQRITSLVQRIAPFVTQLVPTLVAPDEPERSSVRLEWIDEGGRVFGAHQLSDGTLRMIALITALMQPAERLPSFIVIDEPELGLHPLAISLLAGMIRSVSAHSQILIATQAPAILDEFDVEDVVVVERAAGETVLRRLEREPLEIWLETYTLSEIWDKNLIGGNP